MESLNCSTNMGLHHFLRLKKEKGHMENLNLGYQGGSERKTSDTYQKTELFFLNSSLHIMCFNSTELDYTYHFILSSTIQKHLVIVILSEKMSSSSLQDSCFRDTIYKLKYYEPNQFLHILLNTFELQASSANFEVNYL